MIGKTDVFVEALVPNREQRMADTYGWRLKFGVLVPSTNTSVQPEYDAMRPVGVTNHVRAFRIPNAPTRTNAEFSQQLENMRATMVDAMEELLTLEPGYVILATAAESAGGVSGAQCPGGRQLSNRFQKRRSLQSKPQNALGD